MGYSADSFSAGEQPITSKWNKLWANDASFNDGTGIGTNAIAAASLATNAITLGYAQTINTFTTNGTDTNPQQVTGLSTTVTIPAGGRRIKITGYSTDIGTNGGAATVRFSIWDGTVNAGTRLNANRITTKSAGSLQMNIVMAIITPAAGSKTYNIGLQTDFASSSAFIEADATSPAFILVEAI